MGSPPDPGLRSAAKFSTALSDCALACYVISHQPRMKRGKKGKYLEGTISQDGCEIVHNQTHETPPHHPGPFRCVHPFSFSQLTPLPKRYGAFLTRLFWIRLCPSLPFSFSLCVSPYVQSIKREISVCCGCTRNRKQENEYAIQFPQSDCQSAPDEQVVEVR